MCNPNAERDWNSKLLSPCMHAHGTHKVVVALEFAFSLQ